MECSIAYEIGAANTPKDMKTALFINGVYDAVLQEIIASQQVNGGRINYLQPYKGAIIQMLKKHPPTPDDPITLYFSTTKNLNNIGYVAQIVGWADKRTLPESKRNQVLAHLIKNQSGEVNLLNGVDEIGRKAVNLLTLRNVQECKTLLPTSILKKKSDGIALKSRTRAGGWSEVFDVGDILLLPTEPQADFESQLSDAIKKAEQSSESERNKRLATTSRLPERIQLLSTGFRRNADVIVEVLKRAAGICEHCKNPAPFKRKSDGSPFLEVHHWKLLSDGGEDTIENAGALCPNCHRKLHFG